MLHQSIYKLLRCQNLKIGFCMLISNAAQVSTSTVNSSATPPHCKPRSFTTILSKYTNMNSSLVKFSHAPILHMWNWTVTFLSQDVALILGTLFKSKLLFLCQTEWWYHHFPPPPPPLFFLIIFFPSVAFKFLPISYNLKTQLTNCMPLQEH